jgi:hypothetical protein
MRRGAWTGARAGTGRRLLGNGARAVAELTAPGGPTEAYADGGYEVEWAHALGTPVTLPRALRRPQFDRAHVADLTTTNNPSTPYTNVSGPDTIGGRT